MPEVTMDLPSEALASLRLDPESFAREMRLAAAIYWYQRDEVSQGAAARIAGVTRLQFLDILAARKIDVFSVDLDELRREVEGG
ncbi:MAG: UPF0175 family protein [Armatimonadetes bacterium]|nr:UPF0175 family protein [Armatimonadota bacterium]